MWKLAFRNIFRHRFRTILTLTAISIGVAALILSAGFVQDFFVQLREATIHSQLGHIQITRTGYFTFGRRAPYEYMIAAPGKVSADLRLMDHVIGITPRVDLSGLLSNGRSNFSVVGEGGDPEKERELSTHSKITSGKRLTSDIPYGIMLGQGVAEALKLKPGDRASLLVNTPEGAVNSLDFTVVGIFQTASKEYDDRAVRISLSAAEELLGTGAVHRLVIMLNETSASDTVAVRIRQMLTKDGFEVRTWFELADFYQKAIALYERYFTVLQLIILGLILLVVANSVNMTIYQRIGELGTLMAFGNRRRAVLRLVLAENFLLGLIGGGAGALLGIIAACLISAIGIPMPPMPNTNYGYTAAILIVPHEIEASFMIGLVATCLATVLPAWRACRLPIIDALAHN